MVEYSHALTSLDAAEVTKIFKVDLALPEISTQNGYYMTILNFGTFKINESIFNDMVQDIMDTCRGRANLRIRDEELPQNNARVDTLLKNNGTAWRGNSPFHNNYSE